MGVSIVTFPLEQIGWGLRQLSLSGTVGNVLAVIIYLVIGCIPAEIYLLLKKRGNSCKEDVLLLPISAALFVVLYFMVNPGLFQTGGMGGETYLLCGTLYSLLIGYLVLRTLKYSKQADMRGLQNALRILLVMVIVLFAVLILVEFFVNLPTRIAAVREANSAVMGNEILEMPGLTLTYIFLLLRCGVNILSYGCYIVIFYFCIRVLDELIHHSYSEEAIAAVKRTSEYCRKALAAIVVSEVILNVAQILCRNRIYQVDITANVPLGTILFIFAIHVMARYIEENQKLKLDNSLFI